jgi:hypothetical protein
VARSRPIAHVEVEKLCLIGQDEHRQGSDGLEASLLGHHDCFAVVRQNLGFNASLRKLSSKRDGLRFARTQRKIE